VSAVTDAFAAARARVRARRPDGAFRPPAVVYRPPAAGPVPRLRFAAGPATASAAGSAPTPASSEELVLAALAAVERRDAELNAFVHLDADGALAVARERDRTRTAGRELGALHGIPVSVKDVIDVAGMPTRAGCDGFMRIARDDAVAVARLRAAGAVIIGKTVTHQFALGVTTPQSRNPHDPARIPGGSSGGSGIAVATGMGPISLGTDTRASSRVPAALCGVVGFKGTLGLVPLEGVVTLSWTMDHVAPLAASVAEAALTLEVLAGGAAAGLEQASRAGVGGLRVGVPAAAMEESEPAVQAAVRAALDALAAAGCAVVDVGVPDAEDLKDANAAGLLVSRCEAAAVHRGLDVEPGTYWPEVAEQLAEGAATLATDYLDAQRVRTELAQRLRRALSGLDALAMPTTPCVAPLVTAHAGYLTVLSRNAIPWSLAGFPALSVPVATPPGGLPVGLQLVAPPGGEAVLAAIGASVEAARDSIHASDLPGGTELGEAAGQPLQ